MTSPEQISVRRLASEDLDDVIDFEIELARISFPEDPILDRGFHHKRLRRLVDGDGAFVAEAADGHLVGWLWASRRENFSTKKAYCDFHSLYVAQEVRGGAVAFRLMRELFDFCTRNELPSIQGRTAAGNTQMQSIYEAAGFTARHITFECVLDG
ncbi:MAG: GNAT family N-acetyltransferase [Pseudomonadota bacterium]